MDSNRSVSASFAPWRSGRRMMIYAKYLHKLHPSPTKTSFQTSYRNRNRRSQRKDVNTCKRSFTFKVAAQRSIFRNRQANRGFISRWTL